MTASLLPCPSCQRHVRSGEHACPFCQAELALSERIAEFRFVGRLDRARLVTVGAALSAAGFVLGCGPAAGPVGPDTTTPVQSSEPPAPAPTLAPAYGAPPVTTPEPAPEPAPTPPATSDSPRPIAPAYGGPPVLAPKPPGKP